MSFYEKNITVIKEKHKDLYNAICEKKEINENIKCLSVKAKNGTSILCIDKAGKVYTMGSRYNPEKEAKLFSEQYKKILDNSYMIFLGLGSGLLASEIVNTRGKNVKFLFYEPSSRIFNYVLKHFDISELLRRVVVIVKGLNDKYIDNEIGRYIDEENYKWCILDALPVYKQLFNDEFKMLEERYRYYVTLQMTNINTNKYFAQIETYNNIRNMKEILRSNCLDDYKDVFPTNRPAIIVAAGPSLEKNAQLLKKVKGKLFIIAVDTAIRYLVSEGIQPDLGVTADPEKPGHLFMDERVRRIPLAISSGSNNEIIRMMENEKLIFISAQSAYYNMVYNVAGKQSYRIASGGSVATLAFVLAIIWGYKNIILVGQDLAFANGKIHAGIDDVDLEKHTVEKYEIEGYYGDKVLTARDYDFFRKWYEMFLAQNDDIEVINATEGGAKIKGTIQKSLEDVVNEYQNIEVFEFEETIRNMEPTFNYKQGLKVIEMWKNSIKIYNLLKERIYEGIQILNEGIQEIEEENINWNRILNVKKREEEILRELNSYEEIYFVDNIIIDKEGDILSDLFEIQGDDVKKLYESFKRIKKYLKAMYLEIDQIKKVFEELVNSTVHK